MNKEDIPVPAGLRRIDLPKYRKETDDFIQELKDYKEHILSLQPWGNLQEMYEEILARLNYMLGGMLKSPKKTKALEQTKEIEND